MNPHKEAVSAAVKLAEATTPGPWVMSYDKGSTRDIITLKGSEPICIIRQFWVSREAYQANARFIAAAPNHVTLIQQLSDSLDAEIAARAADNVAKDAEIAALAELLDRIHDYAHNKSTGPAVEDGYWEIRSMASSLTTGAAK